MKLDKKQVQHIADLARLDLTEKELKQYGGQLSDILNYIEQLREVDTKGVEPTAQVTGLENIFREDKNIDWDNAEKKAALKEAPEFEDEQVKVKRIM